MWGPISIYVKAVIEKGEKIVLSRDKASRTRTNGEKLQSHNFRFNLFEPFVVRVIQR